MTREQSFAKLKKLSEDEKLNWDFIDFLNADKSIRIEYENPKDNDGRCWILGKNQRQAMISSCHARIEKINKERNQINVTLAMGITDTEVGGGEDQD